MILPAHAENAVIASGAGYKKMVNALNAAYKHETGRSLDILFGNMGRVLMLAKQSGKVDLVLGDESFLVGNNLSLSVRQELGKGKLVLAFAESSAFSTESDLDTIKAQRIALPDFKKAVYGKAAREYLINSGRLPRIQPKLVEVATVPQVFSYLTTNEVDMGFLNLTHALNVADKLGGFVVIDESQYSPIHIMTGLLRTSRHKEEAMVFLKFLKTPLAQSIIHENGL